MNVSEQLSLRKVTFCSRWTLSGAQPGLHIELPELFSTTRSSWAWRTHSYVFSYKLVSKWAPGALEGGGTPRLCPLKPSLFMTEEVLIRFIVWKSPTYQLRRRAGQAMVNRNHQSSSHCNEMKQINCFWERCLSGLLPRVLGFWAKFTGKQLALRTWGFSSGSWKVRELAGKPYFP